ncbi:MAG: phosphoglucosamine mutase [Actinomycetota bacterium]
MARLFGTDGIRGRYGQDFDASLVVRVGRAAADVLGRGHPSPRILIGRDTRASGPEIESALALGISRAGGVAVSAGVIPTAAIAHLVHTLEFEAGAVISASHNPAHDNGIKFFGHDGYKLPDAVEDEIEAAMKDIDPASVSGAADINVMRDAEDRYLAYLLEKVPPLKGISIVVDCANGASFRIAPTAYERAGASVTAIFNKPDGLNINEQCGAVHPERVAEEVLKRQADIGISHDGDADRLIAVDENGDIVDGDQILAICAVHALSMNELRNNAVAATVMANLGFRRAMTREGIRISETPVGDRYVLERMLAEDIVLGGEQSGHLIFLGRHTTGCGILSALRLLSIMATTGRKLSDLAAVSPRLPQVLLNVSVSNREGLKDSDEVWDEVKRVEQEMGDDGRVLVRPSGTEQLVRVMVEASTLQHAQGAAERIAKVVATALG